MERIDEVAQSLGMCLEGLYDEDEINEILNRTQRIWERIDPIQERIEALEAALGALVVAIQVEKSVRNRDAKVRGGGDPCSRLMLNAKISTHDALTHAESLLKKDGE